MSFRTSTGSCGHPEWKSHGLFRLVKGICVFVLTGVIVWYYGLLVVTFSLIFGHNYELCINSFVGTGF